MVNQAEQADVVLAGKGYCPRPRGNYAPGEYHRLTNAEINLQGALQLRRPVSVILNAGNTGHRNTHGTAFIGYLGPWAMYTMDDGAGNITSCWVETTINIGGVKKRRIWGVPAITAAHFVNLVHARIMGFHRYGDRNYWVSRAVTAKPVGAPAMENHIQVLGYNPAGANPLGNSFDPSFFDDNPVAFAIPDQRVTVNTTSIPAFPDAGLDNLKSESALVKSLIYRDRMWIASERTLYFSKATDPMTWAVPDGGFFRFPGQTITDVVAVGQTLYIICESSVWTLQYSTDPNTNAVLTQISNIGGDSACVYEDVVYFARRDILWSCENNRVNKVLDLNFQIVSDVSGLQIPVKLVTFNNYIIFIYQTWQVFQDLIWSQQFRVYPVGTGYTNGLVPHIWLNMENGASHQFEFQDQLADGGTDTGRINDIMVVPYADQYDRTVLYLHTAGGISGGGVTSRGYSYYILADYDSFTDPGDWHDYVCASSDVFSSMNPLIDIELDSLVPDGSQFFIKKFRSLMMETDITGFISQLKFAFGDTSAYSAPIDITTVAFSDPVFDVSGVTRPQYPHRFPINQRARSLTLKITAARAAWSTIPLKFGISKISLLWSPTGRAPVGKIPE